MREILDFFERKAVPDMEIITAGDSDLVRQRWSNGDAVADALGAPQNEHMRAPTYLRLQAAAEQQLSQAGRSSCCELPEVGYSVECFGRACTEWTMLWSHDTQMIRGPCDSSCVMRSFVYAADCASCCNQVACQEDRAHVRKHLRVQLQVGVSSSQCAWTASPASAYCLCKPERFHRPRQSSGQSALSLVAMCPLASDPALQE